MASPATLYRNYRKIAVKMIRMDTKLEFLKECKLNGVNPMSIFRIKLPEECKSVRRRIQEICLNRSVRHTENVKYKTLNKIIQLENQINVQDRSVLVDINAGVTKLTDKLQHKLRMKYKEKFSWICAKQIKKITKDKPVRYILWHQISIPPDIKSVLEKGPNYALDNTKDWKNTMAEIERGIRGMEEVNKDYFRWKTTLKSMNQRPRQTEVKQIKRTKRWLADNNLILTRADKSKHLVIMDKQHYINTLEEYIRNTECERVDQNIIDNLDRKVKKLQKSPITTILPFLKGTSITGPSIPRLFGFAKTHKDKKQIRPVVEKHKGPTYKLEKEPA
ncbi:uncharacterized protein [Centruroides vittatus]|uniref:uncharacterized protein n=1 Tax=Centruroides vittatus TaxID=120091 RepID=UPI00350F61E0